MIMAKQACLSFMNHVDLQQMSKNRCKNETSLLFCGFKSSVIVADTVWGHSVTNHCSLKLTYSDIDELR